jgi:hypothetical protein
MEKLIRNRRVETDNWLLLRNTPDGSPPPVPAEGDVIVPLSLWLARKDALAVRSGRTGVWLESKDSADAIAAAYPRPMGDWRVRCVETGQIWPSCGAAARELHVSQAAVSLAIRQGRQLTALGMTFEAFYRPRSPS